MIPARGRAHRGRGSLQKKAAQHRVKRVNISLSYRLSGSPIGPNPTCILHVHVQHVHVHVKLYMSRSVGGEGTCTPLVYRPSSNQYLCRPAPSSSRPHSRRWPSTCRTRRRKKRRGRRSPRVIPTLAVPIQQRCSASPPRLGGGARPRASWPPPRRRTAQARRLRHRLRNRRRMRAEAGAPTTFATRRSRSCPRPSCSARRSASSCIASCGRRPTVRPSGGRVHATTRRQILWLLTSLRESSSAASPLPSDTPSVSRSRVRGPSGTKQTPPRKAAVRSAPR